MSSGTRASAAGVLLPPGFAWRDGRLVTERTAKRIRAFTVKGRERPAVSLGGSEHLSLPRIAPGLREVNVYLGWFGPASRAVQAFSAAGAGLARVPGGRYLETALTARLARTTGSGPDEAARDASGSHAVAIAYDDTGRQLAEVTLTGPNAYTLTGRLLAWGARRATEHGTEGTGALGPVEAFGLDALREGAAQAGLVLAR